MTILVFIFGAIIGSFLNVCIDRLPRNESLAIPRSHCRVCYHRLRWLDLIPVLSFIWLKGRCRSCNVRIPIHHLIVEVLAPIIFVALWRRLGLSREFLTAATLSSLLLVIAVIDWYWLIIPNTLVLMGLLIGLVDKLILSDNAGLTPFIGLSCGIITLWLPSRVSKAISGKESMGAGDIKLAAMLGLYFGWQGVLVVLWVACCIGAVYGLVGMARGHLNRTSKIPLGFFLSLSAITYLAGEPWTEY